MTLSVFTSALFITMIITSLSIYYAMDSFDSILLERISTTVTVAATASNDNKHSIKLVTLVRFKLFTVDVGFIYTCVLL